MQQSILSSLYMHLCDMQLFNIVMHPIFAVHQQRRSHANSVACLHLI